MASAIAGGDVGRPVVSEDLDGEFARAADLLEAGQREEGEGILDAIARRSGLPAWRARAALLLAEDDRRRGDLEAAAERLDKASAASIGLEAYRRLRRAEALESSGAPEDALAEARASFETDGPFAFRVRAGTAYARLLEKQGRLREAAEALARASKAAKTADEAAELAIARIRLALAARDDAGVTAAARDLLLSAPGHDRFATTPEFARQAAARAEAGLSAAERGRRGAALVASNDARRGEKLLRRDPPAAWPEGERARNLLALARARLALKKTRAAEATAASVPEDGTLASWEAKLFRCDRVDARLRGGPHPAPPDDPRFDPLRRGLEALTAPGVPPAVRRAARERLLRLHADADRFEEARAQAQVLAGEGENGSAPLEPLWRLAWRSYLAGDVAGARARFESLAPLYTDVARSRRIDYWRARCLAEEGRGVDARAVFARLSAGAPADVYARFSRERVPLAAASPSPPLGDPSTATAAFARVDELLRLRMFEEASAEARALRPSKGRDLRLAQSDFALGRFLPAAAAIKRAIPEVGTAEEGRVPDAWRRLFYPIEEGSFLTDRALEFGLDDAVLRGLVRQESVFDARARSRAGAMGLTQLMPATAKSLARTVLRSRYRRAFLYDPGVNARLGAAYLRRLIDRFDGSLLLALAAYNGGPTRIARVLRENPDLEEDELFETIPLYETRDYVRRVMLYAESYRELY